MAKQAGDTKTLELDCIPKKRGRPVTGKAKSAAQRKREQVARDKFALTQSIGSEGQASLKSLIELLKGVESESAATKLTAARAWKEIGSRFDLDALL